MSAARHRAEHAGRARRPRRTARSCRSRPLGRSPARWSRCSARTGRASRPWCAPLSASCRSTPASVRLFGRPLGAAPVAPRRLRAPAGAGRHGRPGHRRRGGARPGLLTGRRLRARATPAGARGAGARSGSTDRADRPVQEMSGGQQQRVLIARALVRGPDLLVLDEPVAGIDLGTSQRRFAATIDRDAPGRDSRGRRAARDRAPSPRCSTAPWCCGTAASSTTARRRRARGEHAATRARPRPPARRRPAARAPDGLLDLDVIGR